MIFEHFALNVPDARSMAAWGVTHLGLTVVRRREEPPFTHFLADATGRVMLEIYSNSAAEMPDYAARHPLVFHWALAVREIDRESARLVSAGATRLTDETLPDGTRLVMLRDPWGVPLQLCARAVPLGVA